MSELTNTHDRYNFRLVPAKSGTGFERPTTSRRLSAYTLRAFFYAWRFLYGVQRGETFGSTGILEGRPFNPMLVATLRLKANMATPNDPLESIMQNPTQVPPATSTLNTTLNSGGEL